jgi:hypothetical protein
MRDRERERENGQRSRLTIRHRTGNELKMQKTSFGFSLCSSATTSKCGGANEEDGAESQAAGLGRPTVIEQETAIWLIAEMIVLPWKSDQDEPNSQCSFASNCKRSL